jgi:cardiolipin synthase
MTWLLLTLHVLLIAGFGLRILLRRDMRPDVRLAWLMVIVLLPYVSCLLYYLFGEVALGRVPGRRRLNVREFCQSRSGAASDAGPARRHDPPFPINGCRPSAMPRPSTALCRCPATGPS